MRGTMRHLIGNKMCKLITAWFEELMVEHCHTNHRFACICPVKVCSMRLTTKACDKNMLIISVFLPPTSSWKVWRPSHFWT